MRELWDGRTPDGGQALESFAVGAALGGAFSVGTSWLAKGAERVRGALKRGASSKVEGTGKAGVEPGSTPIEHRYAIDPETGKLIHFDWTATRRVDPVKDAHIIERVSEIKSRLSKKVLKKGGNFGYAEVDIPVVEQKEFYSSSQVDFTSGNSNLEGFSLKPENPIFRATKAPDKKGDDFVREADTEYKILNDLAEKIGENNNVAGKVKLFTEKDTCGSCNNIISQFKERYPNIKIEVIHNGGELIAPKNMSNIGEY
ncbi:hypothetical protein EDM57_02760 [Brevibacillus gelatini]|uniref:Deaminase n=1 Tax=Brevibacillus gelatini TaxID=1655277 RepID=A0A3M8BAC2_9BACL|nr:hypothetical protein EDM57_02760 [Brevibacillus gelatini]